MYCVSYLLHALQARSPVPMLEVELATGEKLSVGDQVGPQMFTILRC